MYLRSRRSTSSCANNINHSNSAISLQGHDTPNKQGKKYEYCEIQKKYLIPIYHSLQECQNKKQPIGQELLNNWISTLKKGIQRLREYSKQMQNKTNQFSNSLNEFQQNKNNEIRNIKQTLEEEIRFMESQTNKKIIDMNAEYGRKEQEYKEIISKFIQSMQSAQKNWMKNYSVLLSKFKKIEEILKNNLQIDARNKQVYLKIVQFTDGLYEDDDSFASINLSADDLPREDLPQSHQKKTINFSSIQKIEEAYNEEPPVKFEINLMRMISWNFFNSQNTKYILKLIEILKMFDNKEEIFHEPIFPIILQAFLNNINISSGQQDFTYNDNSQISQVEMGRFPLQDKETNISKEFEVDKEVKPFEAHPRNQRTKN